ncbi:hypothetical protein [Methylocapsa palsarum]|uniref:Uncharacterized protein n=1 Tax=Methylocapsa palsarum TaxID=1612308 RepID=A0A1I3ZTP5_9HYPH|nr:hypothetical protein [Methylocapsa palsarum]SFK47016.1 hypothetical protein SAMN05444581_108145 [Methylocapsa palsarum]
MTGTTADKTFAGNNAARDGQPSGAPKMGDKSWIGSDRFRIPEQSPEGLVRREEMTRREEIKCAAV